MCYFVQGANHGCSTCSILLCLSLVIFILTAYRGTIGCWSAMIGSIGSVLRACSLS